MWVSAINRGRLGLYPRLVGMESTPAACRCAAGRSGTARPAGGDRVLDALVCGTENKSEMYLGYFTRFGDEASDIEPIQHLFKTEIRQLAKHLGIPESIQTKAPSAGLWEGQTDETEMGFTYHDADLILTYIEQIDQISSLYDVRTSNLEFRKKVSDELGIELSLLERILDQVKKNHFKHVVPYTLNNDPKTIV
jgi:NAD+ synthase